MHRGEPPSLPHRGMALRTECRRALPFPQGQKAQGRYGPRIPSRRQLLPRYSIRVEHADVLEPVFGLRCELQSAGNLSLIDTVEDRAVPSRHVRLLLCAICGSEGVVTRDACLWSMTATPDLTLEAPARVRRRERRGVRLTSPQRASHRAGLTGHRGPTAVESRSGVDNCLQGFGFRSASRKVKTTPARGLPWSCARTVQRPHRSLLRGAQQRELSGRMWCGVQLLCPPTDLRDL